MANSPSGDSVLDRVMRILEAFDDSTPTLTIGALARRSELPQAASAYRIVDDMTRRCFLDREPNGEVRPWLRLW